MTGEKLVKFAVKLNGKPGIALLDPGSKISMVNRNFVKLLEEGKDYQDLEDLQLLGPGNTELPNQGIIRINKNAGIQLTEDVKGEWDSKTVSYQTPRAKELGHADRQQPTNSPRENNNSV